VMFQLKPTVRYQVYDLIDATSLEEQREIYNDIESRVWNRMVEWLLQSPMLMSMVGVPKAQLNLIDRDIEGGLLGFVKTCLRNIFTRLSLVDNYFWRVYIRGEYTRTCCPQYLREENFEILQKRLYRLSAHTNSFSSFLETQKETFSHFILLDHQDWLAWFRPDLLTQEWNQIRAHSEKGTRVLMRSAGVQVDFCAPHVKGWLQWTNEQARELHLLDRVGTYASCHLGRVGL